MKKINVKTNAEYGGHKLSPNGSVNLTLKFGYSELVDVVKSLQMLNNDISVKVKIAGKKPMKLGMFRLHNLRVDHDGESAITFNGISDYVELDNLNNLPLNTEDEKIFNVMFEAEIEEEEENGEE